MNYYVEEGDTFGLESVTPVGSDTALSPSAYTVFYVWDKNDNGTLDGTDTILNENYTIDHRPGGMPTDPNNYFMIVVKGQLVDRDGDSVTLTSSANWSTYSSYNWVMHEQAFSVKEAKKSLEGVYAFETKATNLATVTDAELSDTDFVYTGNAVKFGFAIDGEAITSADYTITWTAGSVASGNSSSDIYTITDGNAGTYTAHLVGQGAYAGSTADVTLTVEKLNLSEATLTADDVDADNGTAAYDIGAFSVAGTPLAGSEFKVTPLDYKLANGNTGSNFGNMTPAGEFRYLISAATANSTNVEGSCIVTVRAFKDLTPETDFKYGSKTIDGSSASAPFETFYLDRGQSFDPSMLNIDGDYEGFTYTVTKNGQSVESYDEAGVYEVSMVQNPAVDYAKGGSAAGTFVVENTYVDYTNAIVFMFVDGTAVKDNGDFEYDGQAVEPTFVAKNNGKVVDSSAYTITLTKGGDPVESIVDPGDDYAAVIEFADGTKVTINFDVTKASIDSVKADADFYALPEDGSAAQPAFTGSTEQEFDEGLQFALPADQISVVYYKAKLNDKGTADTADDEWVKTASNTPAIAPEDLTEAGDYLAEVNILTTCPTLEGYGMTTHVKVAKAVAFADVDANAWYADEVYTAASDGFNYMNGIGGSNLFMPEADITRAQTAQVLYNMAGGDDRFNWGNSGYFPTKFSDVSPFAWYAKPVYWASEAGVVTGMGDTGTFAPDAEVTREQAATMLYRYVAGQGKAEAATADLSAYADAASVSNWAGEAMQWAVANGVFGVGTDLLRPQDSLSRAEMAAIAVRVQPDGAYTEL